MRKSGLILILTVCLILTLSSTATEDTTIVDGSMNNTPTVNFQKSWETHGAIQIDNDTHFDDVAAVEGWAGGGNATHPYVIEDYEITADGNNIDISDTSRHFIIRDCFIQSSSSPGTGYGVYLFNTPNAEMENVTVFQKGVGFYFWTTNNIVGTELKADSCDNGIFIGYSDNVDFSEIESTDCSFNGIYFDHCDVVTIDTVSASGPGERGVRILQCTYVTLSNAEISDFTYEGLLLNQSTNCQLNDITIYTCGDNLHSGIHCWTSDDVTVTNITTWDIAQGFTVTDSQRFVMEDSYLHDNWQGGIVFWSCIDVTVRHTPVQSHMYFGVGLYNTNTSLIEYCDIDYNNWQGVYLSNSHYSTIAHSTIDQDGDSMFYDEIFALNSDYVTIYNNSISWNRNANGIGLETSDYANITGNKIFNNTANGINLESSYHCTLDNNTIYGNGNDGIFLDAAHWSTLIQQVVHDNGRWGIIAGTVNDTVIEHCTIYSNPSYGINIETSYRIDISHCEVYENGADGVFMNMADNCSVSFSDLWENAGADCEITIIDSSFVTILGNTLMNNTTSQGMYVSFSPHVNITGNTITGNLDDGINIQNSDYSYIA
ncbi:MAG: right-handed parallel beta-helix repeat-containing protein, partial [Candidatus Thorarchaeota archaeon]